jgi:hypothetical protein
VATKAVANTESNFIALRADASGVNIKDIIAANMGGDRLTAFDFDRVRIPTGGGNIWTVPSLEGDQNMQTLEGIIVHWQPVRAYWSLSLEKSDGGTPPDCSSTDGIVGNGDPGGSCEQCPLAQFGSSTKGTRGQACKQMRLLFLIRENDILPLVVVLPPTSIRPAKQFFFRLAAGAVPYYGVVTGITLTKTKNAGGIAYSQAAFSVKRILSDEERDRIEAYANELRPALTSVTIDSSDYQVAQDDNQA